MCSSSEGRSLDTVCRTRQVKDRWMSDLIVLHIFVLLHVSLSGDVLESWWLWGMCENSLIDDHVLNMQVCVCVCACVDGLQATINYRETSLGFCCFGSTGKKHHFKQILIKTLMNENFRFLLCEPPVYGDSERTFWCFQQGRRILNWNAW